MDVYRITPDSPNWQLISYDFVRTDSFVFGQNIPIEREFSHDPPIEMLRGILLVEDHKPIAGCRIAYPTESIAKIERVCVIRERQRSGVGRILIEEAEKWIAENGYRHVVISSQDRAAGFYEKVGYTLNPDADPDQYTWHSAGFDPVAARANRPNLGFVCVLMEKDLA